MTANLAGEPISKNANAPDSSNIDDVARELSNELRVKVDPIRLGLLIIATAPGNDAASSIGALFSAWGETEWRSLADLADEEIILTWVTHRLAADSLGCPSAVVEEMREKSALRRKWNRVIGLAAIDLCERLKAGGVYTTILKGAPLSVVCYGAADLRDVRDIDILVAPHNAFRASEILTAAGYACEIDRGWLRGGMTLKTMRQISFRSLGGALEIDLHWKVANPWVDSSVNKIDAEREQRSLDVFGRSITWVNEETALNFARANVIGSHRVEIKASVDCWRLDELRSSALSEASSNSSLNPRNVTMFALSIVTLISKHARLSVRATCSDLVGVAQGEEPTRFAVWRRNAGRIRNVTELVALCNVAFLPSKKQYGAQGLHTTQGTALSAETIRRKLFRR